MDGKVNTEFFLQCTNSEYSVPKFSYVNYGHLSRALGHWANPLELSLAQAMTPEILAK